MRQRCVASRMASRMAARMTAVLRAPIALTWARRQSAFAPCNAHSALSDAFVACACSARRRVFHALVTSAGHSSAKKSKSAFLTTLRSLTMPVRNNGIALAFAAASALLASRGASEMQPVVAGMRAARAVLGRDSHSPRRVLSRGHTSRKVLCP